MVADFRRPFEQFEEDVKIITENIYDCTANMAEKNQLGYDIKVDMKKDGRVIAIQCKYSEKRRVSGPQVIKFIEYMKNYSSQNEFYEGWLISSIGFTPAAIAEAEKEMNVKISLGTVRSNKIDWDYSNADNFTNSENTSNSDNSNSLFEKLDKCCYIGIFANKGGTGKTTIAAHLAGAFSLKGHDVIVLDVDPQRNLKKLFQNDKDNSAFYVKPIPPKKVGNVIEVLDEKEWEEEKTSYPNMIVICDCNPTFAENPIELIKEFDYCIIPISLSPLGISKRGDVIKRTFDKIRTENKNTEMDVLVNYYDESKGKSKRTELLLDLVKNKIPFDEDNNLHLIDPVKTCAIHRSDPLFYWGMHIVEKRKPELAFNNGPTSRVREDFLKLAEYFLKKIK